MGLWWEDTQKTANRHSCRNRLVFVELGRTFLLRFPNEDTQNDHCYENAYILHSPGLITLMSDDIFSSSFIQLAK